jgi:hypothetical protein
VKGTSAYWADLAVVLGLVAALALAALGWGAATARLLGFERRKSCDLLRLSWLGWSALLLLIQLVQFVAPLSAPVASTIYLAGIVLAVPALRERFRTGVETRERWRPGRSAYAGAGGLVLTGFVASRAMAAPQAYDFGLYHLSVMRWATAHPIVPGLGNLQPRLAFNQSSLLFSASLDLEPYFGHGRVLAITYLTVLLALTVAGSTLGFGGAAGRPRIAAGRLEPAAALLLAPVTAYLVVYSPDLSSATPDQVSSYLQIAAFLALCRGIDCWRSGERAAAELRSLALLASTAITVKLSSFGFAAVCLAIALGFAGRGGRLRSALASAALPALVLLVWMGRGVVLSGMPLFPSTVARLPVEWAVPREAAIDTANWIYSWARRPSADWGEVLERWDWLGPWFRSVRGRTVEFAGPLTLAVALAAALGILALTRTRPLDRRLAWIALPPLAGTIYWWGLAPDPRFLGAQAWLLAVAAALLVGARLGLAAGSRSATAATAVAVALFAAPPVMEAAKRGLRPKISTVGIQAPRQVRLRAVRNEQGVRFFVPRRGDQCWAAPLLCVPKLDPALRLRDPHDPGRGFRVAAGEAP